MENSEKWKKAVVFQEVDLWQLNWKWREKY